MGFGWIAAPVLCLVWALTGGGPVGPGMALAAESAWARGGKAEARLVAAVDGAGDLSAVPLGLEIRMSPGWKTYWRSPGDAGLPPRLDWTGSANLEGATLRYPAPHRFTLFGLETVGYSGEVLFPLTVQPERPGGALDLRLGLDLLVCDDTLCIPDRLDLALSLPAGPAGPDADAANRIARAQAQVPGDGTAHGLSVRAVGTGSGPRSQPELVVRAAAREPFVDPDLFIEPPGGQRIAFGAPRLAFSRDGREATIRVPVTEAPADLRLEGLPVVLTLVDGARSAEVRATVGPAGSVVGPLGAADVAGPALWLAMLATAFLGGLVLNLMPCVLPVLSLKLLSVVSHAGEARRGVRIGFLASAAGVLFSFWVLAAGLVALKAAGAVVGWGIQFQQPLFLVLMVAVVTLFACNLWGLFEVPLPRALADAAAGRGAHAGQGTPSPAGHFATGALATLLATPCSAPFVGTAIGFALARGPLEVVSIFTALGLGLALPYLTVAAAPGLVRHLPRPGRWTIVLRRVLGGLLGLTAVWLLSVLAAQVGPVAAVAVGGLMVAFAAVLLVRRRTGGGLRAATAAAAAVVLLAAFGAPAALDHASGPVPHGGEGGGEGRGSVPGPQWMPFARPAIVAEVAAGRVVFVDVTADWCVTCQVNKRLVLGRAAVAAALEDEGVVPMRADWTRPDPAIAVYLQERGRYGIPFNAVYGPGAPDGIVLPELLTEGAVLDALARAGGPAGG